MGGAAAELPPLLDDGSQGGMELIRMNKPTKRLLFWSPRILGIAFAIFLSLFALDVFSEGLVWWKTLLALAIHLIPTAIIVVVLAASWRWEWVGGVLFIALGILYLKRMWHHPAAVAGISGPLFLLGALFLLNWWKRAEIRA